MKIALLLVLVIGQVLASDIVDNLVVGYQGWFGAPNDGSPIVGKWLHWARWGEEPSPGHITFELYPDVREYQKLYPTQLGNLGNGQPAQLFSSWDESTIDLHFKWMKDYNIGTAALQRFPIQVKNDQNFANLLNGIANIVRKNAEKHGRKFYIMWDISGWDNFDTELIEDLDKNIKDNLKIFDSPAYARHDGKLVVCIWGFGFLDRPDKPDAALNIINELKNRGYYVIGGVPLDWRSGTGSSRPNYANVYRAFNMIQPWSVGAFKSVDEARNYQNLLREDINFCRGNGMEFQPVLSAGFAWSNWNAGHLPGRNVIPRQHGDYMWQQFVNLRELGTKTAYVAMFDEYDEGTAIAKAAEDGSMIPNNQYFLTLDVDGVHVSSDFYLRLVDAGTKMLKEQMPLTPKHNVPFQ